MNIEEIMKPYYDKKNELENKYVVNRNFLKMRLENLRNNKEKEIEEYINSAVSERPNFYTGYGAMIRKDLEQSYAAKEAEIEEQINNIDKSYKQDMKEFNSIKFDLRIPLNSLKKELELNLKEVQIDFDTVMLKLARTEHTNYDEYKRLFEKSNELIEVKYNIQRQLKQIEENLEQLSKEETIIENKVEEVIVEKEEEIETEKEEEVETEKEEEVETEKEEEAETEKEEEAETEKEEKDVEQTYPEFIKTVYSDVLSSAKKLRSIKLSGDEIQTLATVNEDGIGDTVVLNEEDEVELPNGTYLNRKDIEKALDNYRKQNKGRTFRVKGIDKTFEVTRKNVNKVKRILRECSIIKLLREKKLSFFDIKRVFGKEKADEYSNRATITTKTNMPDGDYVNLKEFTTNLRKLFTEKSTSWYEKLTGKLIKEKVKDETETNDFGEEEKTIVKAK